MAEMMALLSSIYRHGIWRGFFAFVVFAYLLAHCIAGVIRTERQARLFSVPLVESQVLELAEAGPVVLAMEGPILSQTRGTQNPEPRKGREGSIPSSGTRLPDDE